MEIILGLIALYSAGHTAVLTFVKGWKHFTSYEKVVSVVGWMCIGSIFIGIMAG